MVVDGYGDHEIASPLMGMATFFPMAQALTAVGEPDSPVTGRRPRAHQRPVLGRERSGHPLRRPARSSRPGATSWVRWTSAYVLELPSPAGRSRRAGMVVFGNSEFLNNANLNQGGNRDLLSTPWAGWPARRISSPCVAATP